MKGKMGGIFFYPTTIIFSPIRLDVLLRVSLDFQPSRGGAVAPCAPPLGYAPVVDRHRLGALVNWQAKGWD